METQTDLEQQKAAKPTNKTENSIICDTDSRLRYLLIIIAMVVCIAIITLSFYLKNKFKT